MSTMPSIVCSVEKEVKEQQQKIHLNWWQWVWKGVPRGKRHNKPGQTNLCQISHAWFPSPFQTQT
jgi:hypothetical protein